jgi:CubicO group peptidase (beta-lactamase class C family)
MNDNLCRTIQSFRGTEGINSFMRRYYAEEQSAGMLTLVSQNGKIVHHAVCGYADIASRSPIREDTIFRIYSMSKPITSVALMCLLESGKFHLDDAAEHWIPEMQNLKVQDTHGKLQPLQRPVTIRHLLTHTAGFSYGANPDAHPVEKKYDQAWHSLKYDKSLEEMIKIMLEIPLINQPDTKWHYSIATDICGYLVELISEMPFGDYLQKTLFHPLGMVDTGFEVSPQKQSRFANLYGYKAGAPLVEMTLKSDSPYVTKNQNQAIKLQCGGSGLVSTATDYWRFSQMMLSHGEFEGAQIISRKTVEWMTMNHLRKSMLPLSYNGIVPQTLNAYGFGLGYCINIDPTQAGTLGSLGDFGWGGIAGTYCWCDPKESLVGILMQSYMPEKEHKSRRDFRNSVYQGLS